MPAGCRQHETATACGRWREKARGRNRVTGNFSVRSRRLAPPQLPPRIPIADDVPRGAASGSWANWLHCSEHCKRHYLAGGLLKRAAPLAGSQTLLPWAILTGCRAHRLIACTVAPSAIHSVLPPDHAPRPPPTGLRSVRFDALIPRAHHPFPAPCCPARVTLATYQRVLAALTATASASAPARTK